MMEQDYSFSILNVTSVEVYSVDILDEQLKPRRLERRDGKWYIPDDFRCVPIHDIELSNHLDNLLEGWQQKQAKLQQLRYKTVGLID